MQCSSCGKTITGQYYTLNATQGQVNLCSDCNQLPRTFCNGKCDRLLKVGEKVLLNYFPYNNSTVSVCDTCNQRSLTSCAGNCNTLLKIDTISVVNNYSYKNATLCEPCHGKKLIICTGNCNTLLEVGGRVVVSYQPYNNDVGLCSDCQQKQPVTCIGNCNTLLVVDGQNVVNHTAFPYSLLHACDSCTHEASRCGTCSTPAAIKSKLLPSASSIGSDYRCSFCTQNVVNGIEAAMQLYQQVYGWISNPVNGLELTPQLPLLTLADRKFLNGKNGVEVPTIGNDVTPSHTLGYCAFTWEDEKITKRDIYIEHYLTKVMFMATAAHELTHAWQYEKGLQGKQTEQIREGFPEWVAYSFLSSLVGNEEAERYRDRLCTNGDKVYGDGLRLFIEAYKQGGIGAVLELAKQTNK